MAPLAMNRVASRVSAPAACPRARVVRAPRTVVFAEEPRFTLDNSKQSAEGFVEKDTAGQSNMYPTIIKPFEAGSPADTVEQDTFNNGIAVGGSVVALSAIGLGLAALLSSGSGSGPAADEAAYLSLSDYSSKFSEQLATTAPAPAAVAEVLAAPALAAAAVSAVPEVPAVVEVVEATPVEVAEAVVVEAATEAVEVAEVVVAAELLIGE